MSKTSATERLFADAIKPRLRGCFEPLSTDHFEFWLDSVAVSLARAALAARKADVKQAPAESCDAQTLARKLYEAHAKFHGFSGERWNDEPWQSRHSWLNIAKTALEYIQPADTISGPSHE